MSNSVQKLIDLLQLTQVEPNVFQGDPQDLGYGQLFGGQVIAQALSAASKTIIDRFPHSLHAYFLRPGHVNQPLRLEVYNVRDGKSFSVRRVLVLQQNKEILNLTASFHRSEPGLEHQVSMPQVPPPEVFEPEVSVFRRYAESIPLEKRSYFTADRPIEFRIVEPHNPFKPRHAIGKRHMWIRASAPLPEDPLVHQSMLAYTSDYGFLETSLLPHGLSIVSPNKKLASLDHAIWFHRPFRLDEWLLYVADSPSASNSRGFVRGDIFNQQGVLVASTTQEGLIRVTD